MNNRNLALSVVVIAAVAIAYVYKGPGETIASNFPEQSDAALPDESIPGGIALSNFADFPLKMAAKETVEEVEKELGPPLSYNKRLVENVHAPSQKDTVHELKYEGLQINVFESSGEEKKSFIVSIFVDQNKYELSEDMKIGMSKADVLNKFGAPESTSANSISYTAGSGAGNSVELHFKDDTLTSVEWHSYID